MGKMLDNVRSWWNSITDSLGDPGKLAQLSVVDLEKSIRKAKEAAAPVVGRPAVLTARIKDMSQTDKDLSDKITALIKSGADGQTAAIKYIERQVAVRKELDSYRSEHEDAKAAADEWQAKIRILETELYTRRNQANRLQAQYETAKAEQSLGRQMQNADGLMGSDKFSSLQARVEKEQAKAAGYSAMSGLDDKAADDKIIKNAESSVLMEEYLRNIQQPN